MNEHDTTVLTSRLHRLADDMTPPLDVVGQVREARARHQRTRRGRIALLAVATATAAVVVGTATAVDLLSAGDRAEVAAPRIPSVSTSAPAPTTTVPAPTTPVTVPAAPSTPEAEEDAWEARRFLGVTFAVPPGARTGDVVDDVPVTSWMDGPSFTWNGPLLGEDEYSYVTVRVTETFEGGMAPLDGGRWFTVPGAEQAYGDIEEPVAIDGIPPVDRTIAWLAVLAGDRVVHVHAAFPAGPEGERMAEALFASLVVS